MNYKFLELEKTNSVLQIFFNRPEVHNALNQEIIDELKEIFSGLNRDDSVRLVILRGRGKSFSSGADLNYMREQANMNMDENLEDALNLAKLFYSIYNCDKPVISVAHGNVAGGAHGIIAASDYAISTNETIFRFSEVRLGLVPATIAPYVIDRIGRARAAELLLSGKPFSGADAERYFLVNSSVPAAQLEKEVKRISDEFLKAAPGASVKTKRLIRSLSSEGLDEKRMKETAAIIAEARASDEGIEGIKSFFESRKANWLNESIQ